ncbi:MAG TPA: hypothetical protein VEK08_01660 [Planctomycetota bacterium]|nr:hypothetical protein [Planctomycetota bacterium]
MRINPWLLLALSLLALSLRAGETAPMKTELIAAPEITLPEAAAKVEAAWKLKDFRARLLKSGATGRTDAFWELLNLCEADAKARGDADIAAVMSWLLFEAQLLRDVNLAAPLYIKLPVVLPELGVKILAQRMESSLANIGLNVSGHEPWLWPDFREIDKTALLTAAQRTFEQTPKNNPLVRLQLAATLLACGGGDAPKEFSAARLAVEKSHPQQARQCLTQLVEGLVNAGVKDALLPLLDLAEADAAEGPVTAPVSGSFRGSDARPRTAQSTLFRALGWIQQSSWQYPQNDGTQRIELPAARAWLEKNAAAQTWNSKKKVFTCDSSPPGKEALYAAAKVFEQKYGFEAIDRLVAGPQELNTIIKELIALFERTPEAAKDPAGADLLLGLLEARGGREGVMYDDRSLMLVQLPKMDAKLGERLWVYALRKALSRDGTETVFQSLEPDPAVVRAACLALLPEYQKAFDSAVAAGNSAGVLQAGMQMLFLDGRPDEAKMLEHMAKAPLEWVSGRREGKLHRWGFTLFNARRMGYLRYLLMLGAKDVASYRAKRGDAHPIGQFQHICSWNDHTDGNPGSGEEQLALCRKWLEENESKLMWDRERHRITGARSPAKAQLAATIEPLTALGFKMDDLMNAVGYAEQEAARRMLESILGTVQPTADAAKNAAIAKAIFALADVSKASENDDHSRKLMAAVSRISREAGVEALTAMLSRELELTVKNNSTGRLSMLENRFIGVDPAVLSAAREKLAAQYRKKVEEPEATTAHERSINLVHYLWLGGELDIPRLEKILADLNKTGGERRIDFEQWAKVIGDTGNLSGLRLLLALAKVNPASRMMTLARFESFCGFYNSVNRQLVPREPDARLEFVANWFATNEKEIKWSPERRSFVAPVMPEQPRPAPQGTAPVKPPAPPAEPKEF